MFGTVALAEKKRRRRVVAVHLLGFYAGLTTANAYVHLQRPEYPATANSHVRAVPQALAKLIRPHGPLKALLSLSLPVHVDTSVLQLRNIDPSGDKKKKAAEHPESIASSRDR